MHHHNCQETPFISSVFIQLAHLLLSKGDVALKQQFDLTHSQCQVMFLIQSHPNIPQQQLADFLQVSPAAISKIVSLLVEKKYIRRLENPQNRRENTLSLTISGTQQLSAANSYLIELESQFYSQIDQEQLSNCLLTIQQLQQLLLQQKFSTE